jgi:exopolysaccharide biosynthesis polyprenyl glycosylphosphotransferase
VLVDDAPVIEAAEPLRAKSLSVDEVVVAVPPSSYPNLTAAIENLEDLGKPIRAVFDLGPRLSFGSKLFQAGRLQMMNLAISPVESFAYTVVKRTFDLTAATLGIVTLSPMFLAIAALVKFSSPGPILFRQERIGRHGKPFTLLKFRTMHCSSKNESDTLWTTKNDPRCTVIGTVLRRFSLDELPQLLNVVRGEMSLVGPRPERPFYVAKFEEDFEKYNMRHRCHVGMTGWAQVNGLRGDTSISDRLQFDLYYMRNWSFGLDLQIIFQTLVAIADSHGY